MVERWDIVVIGHPSRNPYWGEPRDQRMRTPVCTCSLITGNDYRLLVDPSYSDVDRMAAELHRRSGLTPDEVDMVFVTHAHGDHTAGLGVFPEAQWLAGPEVAEMLNSSARFGKPINDATEALPADIELVPSPGHVAGHCSLRFDCEELSVVIAGDAILTKDFCRDGLSSFGTPDPGELETVAKLKAMADALVPGHDNWCLCRK
jgi:glyoxylase-like metal-dependent hydrolase (beta-lactamase superfamily II)